MTLPLGIWRRVDKSLLTMIEIFSFEELSAQAKAKAVADYIGGWEETHEIGDISLLDALSALRDDYPLQGLDNYLEDGTFVR